MHFVPKVLTEKVARERLGVLNMEAFDNIFSFVFPRLARNEYRRGTFADRASEFLGANLDGRFFIMVDVDSEEMTLAKVKLIIDKKFYRAVEIKRALASQN